MIPIVIFSNQQIILTAHLKQLIETYSLTQLIKEPTRTTHTTQTIIDHIITNRPERVSESGVMPCGISDHDFIFMTKKSWSPKSKLHHVLLIFETKERFYLRAFQHDNLSNILMKLRLLVRMLMKFGFNGKLSSLIS